MAMDVRNLSVARGGVRVLEGLGFALGSGQVLVLRGANGIGKTTLLRTLAGLQPAVAGEIVAGEIAYGGHADGLKAALSVAENLAFWAAINGVGGNGFGGNGFGASGGTGIEAALEAMELGALRHRRAGDLSAGQKRRLGLARLLLTGAVVWLLDEPTVSLDAASVALFVAALRLHLGQGGAAVIATHVELGLPEARDLDLTPFRAAPGRDSAFDQALA